MKTITTITYSLISWKFKGYVRLLPISISTSLSSIATNINIVQCGTEQVLRPFSWRKGRFGLQMFKAGSSYISIPSHWTTCIPCKIVVMARSAFSYMYGGYKNKPYRYLQTSKRTKPFSRGYVRGFARSLILKSLKGGKADTNLLGMKFLNQCYRL